MPNEIKKGIVTHSDKKNHPKILAKNGVINPQNDKKVGEYRLRRYPYKL